MKTREACPEEDNTTDRSDTVGQNVKYLSCKQDSMQEFFLLFSSYTLLQRSHHTIRCVWILFFIIKKCEKVSAHLNVRQVCRKKVKREDNDERSRLTYCWNIYFTHNIWVYTTFIRSINSLLRDYARLRKIL